MPRIFDNIDKKLLPALKESIGISTRGDFCVGYFNLRGWKAIDSYIEQWEGGEGKCCRLLVGMHPKPEEELHKALSLTDEDDQISNKKAIQLKTELAEEFRRQLSFGAPTDVDEAGLRRLAAQIKSKKLIVKLFLRHKLHAKLYLLHRPDPNNPIVGFLGSSNLTFAGLSQQGELNVDVLDHDACNKLSVWFENLWEDKFCIDISEELVQIIEESWAREEDIPPYHIFIKMAYHLSQDAIRGLTEFRIPKDFGNKLFEFQKAAVKIAARYLNKQGGVVIGDVVGLGKTLMATALARIFEDDYGLETLIICPKNLESMWVQYHDRYRLRGKILPISRVIQELPELTRYRIVIIDESHNLRNREGKRFAAIQDYIQRMESKCIMLSATPYNKTYLDLSNQLRLFVPEDKNLGIIPEQLLREIGKIEFNRRYQCSLSSLAAFEKSQYPDDWRELMRLFMVRRTRSFVQDNYAETDPVNGRKYLTFEDGTPSYFPVRIPKTMKFSIDDSDAEDQYARLYSDEVVGIINSLNLPRYGLGNYITPVAKQEAKAEEKQVIEDLSRAGKRLMGFCRTNLFKRLESSGEVFVQSLERHILRNYVYLYAVEEGQPTPIGTQDVALFDPRISDEDADSERVSQDIFDYSEENSIDNDLDGTSSRPLQTEADFRNKAEEIYKNYLTEKKRKFKWLPAEYFNEALIKHLKKDTESLFGVFERYGKWNPSKDTKLDALYELLNQNHPNDKVIVFSQFADTVRYVSQQLKERGLTSIEGVTGGSPDVTKLAWRFSPVSNEKRKIISSLEELRVLIATDVLSEGQNLQDCYIVVNYDLPWAIIRLIQRAGRVDRIGQKAEEIFCYSFLPAEGVERILKLRARVRTRLKENEEVVGTDEAFFEDDRDDRTVRDLYSEKAGILDGEADTEVDLASYAYQIWKNAVDKNPKLRKIIEDMPGVVYSTKSHFPKPDKPEGVLVYVRTANDTDALAWMDKDGKNVTESQYAILKAAECPEDTPALERFKEHHELVKKGVEHIVAEEKFVGGSLGRPSGARHRTYTRLQSYAERIKGTLFESKELLKALEDIYRHPLTRSAKDVLNRQLRSGVTDEDLAKLVLNRWEQDNLCVIHEGRRSKEPQIICSLGLKSSKTGG